MVRVGQVTVPSLAGRYLYDGAKVQTFCELAKRNSRKV